MTKFQSIRATVILEKFIYTAIKLSVLFLYRRIFGIDEKFRKANNVLIGLISIWGLTFLFLDSFICVSGSNAGSLDCAGQEWTLLWFAITEVLGDIAILALPYRCIRQLQMSRREKFCVAAVFALGSL